MPETSAPLINLSGYLLKFKCTQFIFIKTGQGAIPVTAVSHREVTLPEMTRAIGSDGSQPTYL